MIEALQISLRRLRTILVHPVFWGLLLFMSAITVLHYCTSQERALFLAVDVSLRRHAVDRIIFILPVALAAYVFGRSGGLITLTVTICAMMPRVIWLSPYPVDALLETVMVGIAGYLIVWMFEVQCKERVLRQQAVSRLSAVNEIAGLVTSSLDLNEIIPVVLHRTMDVVDAEAGLLFTVDLHTQELILVAHKGVPAAFVTELCQSQDGDRLCERVARSGEMLIVQQPPPYLSECLSETNCCQAFVPLKSRNRVRGVLVVFCRRLSRPMADEEMLLTAIGNEIGVAIENAQLYDSMRSYARAITRAQEDERLRIARELHDETIQVLVALGRQLEALDTLPEPLPAAAKTRVRGQRDLVRNALRGLRRFVRDLRPPVLDQLGLVAALRELTTDMRDTYGIHATLEVQGAVTRLRIEQELVLFRIAQEALNNVRQHAGASRVTVHLTFEQERVQMDIEDNGGGFNAPERISDLAPSGRLGLIGMEERARALGGALSVRSTLGRGVTVIVDIPIELGIR
jgi:two-component system, NarL family, sensor histidine kinase DegS